LKLLYVSDETYSDFLEFSGIYQAEFFYLYNYLLLFGGIFQLRIKIRQEQGLKKTNNDEKC